MIVENGEIRFAAEKSGILFLIFLPRANEMFRYKEYFQRPIPLMPDVLMP